MKPRFTTWLLTALLAFAGCFGVPVARVDTARAPVSIVWVEKSQRPEAARRTRREIAEPFHAAVSPRPKGSRTFAEGDFSWPLTILGNSLFQRPPPALPRGLNT